MARGILDEDLEPRETAPAESYVFTVEVLGESAAALLLRDPGSKRSMWFKRADIEIRRRADDTSAITVAVTERLARLAGWIE